MNMKKWFVFVLSLCLIFALTACGSNSASGSATVTPETTASAAVTEAETETDNAIADSITLWTYPIGGWGNKETVTALTDAFTQETGISVSVEYLSYEGGDEKVSAAIASGTTPDLIMEGPERLVGNWGAQGCMVDLSDMLDDEDISEIDPNALNACYSSYGSVYEYPLVVSPYCMAINYDTFVESGADEYVDIDTHTWTTEQFFKAVATLFNYYGGTVCEIYCGGQGGDQGTRALITNLYGGTFTDEDHTTYTWDNDENVQAITELRSTNGITFATDIQGADEAQLFYNESLKMAFCWSVDSQKDPAYAGTGSGLTVNSQRIVFMSFPSEEGESRLSYGIWGFGIFNNKDDARIAAAKEFIKYMCDSEYTVDAVKAADFFPARSMAEGTDLSTVWANDEVMNEYSILNQYIGDYYQITPNWEASRTAWWNMLQSVVSSYDISGTVSTFCEQANNPTADTSADGT